MTRPVELAGGTIAYGDTVVLQDIDMHIDEGESVVLLGANGSGKTTLVRALLGAIPLRRGRLLLFGRPAARFKQWARIGYVPQRFTAATGVPATVREVVLSGRAALRGLLRPYNREDRLATGRVLKEMGLSDRQRDPVGALSGGLQQRTLIARALVSDPELLILDEPVAGVDAESQEAFAAILARLKARGHSMLLVAHSLGAMEQLIDRAVVLEAGRVVFDGPPDVEGLFGEHVHHASDHHALARGAGG